MKINVLSTELANQIAAGEVVERPSSAVKELVENALDANAQNVTIDIADGGLGLIRVTDDGCGMDAADLRLCLMRHATSKLQTLSDLFAISTLGFRGEALPSIAAVSTVEISSRTREGEEGYRLTCRGGKMLEFAPVGMPIGTTVEVKDLFFNTPARLKFMKNPSAEGQKVLQILERLAFSNPLVRFTFSIDRRVVLQTPGNGSLIDVAQAIYGAKTSAMMRAFPKVQSKSLALSGAIGLPALHRHNRLWQSFFLNGRYIENRRLTAILEQVYRTLIPSTRYPVAILHLEVAVQDVDVNVHPTKVEVRFRDEQSILGEFATLLRHQLLGMAEREFPVNVVNDAVPENKITPIVFPSYTEFQAPNQTNGSPLQLTLIKAEADYRLIGQVGLAYILVEKQGKLVIVDQHAAHERILWEQFMAQKPAVQTLAVPITIDFGPSAHFIPSYAPHFAELGFELEHFGGNSYLLRSIPVTYLGNFEPEVLRSLLLDLDAEDLRRGHEALAAKLACRAAIRAGTKMSPSEMVELLDQLYSAKLPFSCPHGRPVEISFSESEIYALFHPK